MTALTAPGSDPQPRRILLAGLSETDARRLEVFLVVRSDRLRHEWQIVTEGPVDVYLHGADEAPTSPGSLDRTPHQVRVIDDAQRADPDDLHVLCRPLQYEAFINVLAAAEQQMQRHASAAALAPAFKPRALAARFAAPADAAVALAPSAMPLETTRFRLRRWPGASLLDAIHQGMRLASFITVRHLTLDELSQLSGVDRDGCRTFLTAMMQADLLRAEPIASEPSPAARPTHAATAARPDRALLSSLRTKLGIRPEGR